MIIRLIAVALLKEKKLIKTVKPIIKYVIVKVNVVNLN